MAVAGLHKSSTFGIIDRSTTRTSTIRKMWRELESEGRVIAEDKTPNLSSSECESMKSEDTQSDANGIENECPQNQNQIQNVQQDEIKPNLQQSPFDVPAKERVRKVFRDWGSKSFEGRTAYTSRMNNCSVAQSVGENECKRVRILRESSETGSGIEKVGDKSVILGVVAKRSICRIYGRQAVLDLLAKFVRERGREVDGLLENQFVSHFAHRHRIQSFLKGRFLRNKRFVENEKQSSVAASELGLLGQTHSVSDIRKGFMSRLKNEDHAPEVTQSHSDNEQVDEIPDQIGDKFPNPQESDSETSCDMPHDEREIFSATVAFTETRIQNLNDSDGFDNSQAEEEWHEDDDDDDSEWHHLTSDEGIYVNSPLTIDSQESNEEWYDNNVHEETPQSWFGGNCNTFDWSDDNDNDRRFELTQLTNRRTVSNLLQSDFGPRLDQLLMQSYVERQNQAFDNESETEAVDSVNPQTRIINGLRLDMDNLQKRLNEMQSMLEACMNMQHELHKELNSALNQPSCYLCCENEFESLPDRCGGDVYICSKCGDKINWSKVKESVIHS